MLTSDPQKQSDRWYHPVTYASQSLTVHEHNYHSTKQVFLALKWVIAKQFQEYLHWKLPFMKNWQEPTYLYFDNSQFRFYLTSLGGVTSRIHIYHLIPERKKPCCCRCSEPCCNQSREVHPGWGHHRDCWKSQCLWPDGDQSRWKNTSASRRNCCPRICHSHLFHI